MINKIIIIDGSSFVFRAFYALPEVIYNAQHVGAVIGFCNMMLKILCSKKAEYIVIVFDTSKDTFRKKIFPEYKANRQKTPENLVSQFLIIKEASQALNMPIISIEGFEADDIIASISRISVTNGIDVEIISPDKDLLQLMTDKIRIFDPIKDRYLTMQDIMEKFGVLPHIIPDVQALLGDRSDNIPGVHGIGIKTAAELINEFGSLENLLNNLEKIKNIRKKSLIMKNIVNARLSYELACLKQDIIIDITEFKYNNIDVNILNNFIEKYNLYNRSIMRFIKKL